MLLVDRISRRRNPLLFSAICSSMCCAPIRSARNGKAAAVVREEEFDVWMTEEKPGVDGAGDGATGVKGEFLNDCSLFVRSR